MNIIFDDRQEYIKIDESIIDKIKVVIVECLKSEGYSDDYDVSLSFVTNDEIREINRDYRNIDKVTDVLSFPLLSEDETGLEYEIEYEETSLGDIVISIERAYEQAKEYDHSLEREICFLVCHSMFHLLGYDHMESEEKDIMRKKEEGVLTKLGITRE
ncbi:rRNA maturation RNase YbeY [Peptostreptococcus faecalis]|uniref:rRNA maturation RNase YbeY n=1 Tax=Peptostreptococcus faecalis TaxID=2045015 RepID=UPI000C796770|nr:rRNA maturation RNase YbeY [Peptostreptococcus faecalis]